MSEIRAMRKDFIVPRCTGACPAGVDVPRYIRAVKDGRYDDAVGVLRENIPFPVVCADACFAPCEDVCAYRQFGDPIAIRALKRAAVDNGGDAWKANKKVASDTGKRVAIVGAGPAGLTAAYYLATLGHHVTIMDAFPKAGGMMRYGIPSYRLPQERLDRDIQHILDMKNVEFQGEKVIGRDVTINELKSSFDAVYVAAGASSSTRIPLKGSDKEGVLWGWDFLTQVGMERAPELGARVAVVGGGNVAIDVALTAKRLGAKQVDVFCLESRQEMPAHPWEIALAEEEGVTIHNAWAPKKVLGDERATGLGLMRCASVFDDACNFNPVYDEEITWRVDVDTIILAVGQASKLDLVDNVEGIAVQSNRIKTGDDSQATGMSGIFAGGDVVTGPKSIVSAIAQGRRAAGEIDAYFGGSGDIREVLAPPEEEVVLSPLECRRQPRHELPHLRVWERDTNFRQVEKALDLGAAHAEADRCLNCDARKFEVTLAAERCKECGYCAEVCQLGTFGPADFFNVKGYRPMEVKCQDFCVGCFKCFFSCPDFAIDVKEKTA